MDKYQLIVIGGGAGGMSAALSAAENGLDNILIIEGEQRLGGILNQCIHMGFGLHYFKEEMSGPSYASRLAESIIMNDNIKLSLNSFVTHVSKDKIVEYICGQGKVKVCAEAIIFATGSYERHASMINLPGKRLNGIYTAGAAQKYINSYNALVGKKVFILGSGDIGLIMARRMTLEGAEVVGVAELMPYSNGLTRNIVTCLEDFGIPLYLSHTVTATSGDRNLESVTISQVDDKLHVISGTEKEFDVDCLLLAVGLIPLTTLMEGLELENDPRTKSVIIDSTYQTSMEGVFVCGNSLHVHDLVDFVSKEATIVGSYVAEYVTGKIDENSNLINIENDNNIGYIMPQYIDISNAKDRSELFFRVKKPLRNCILQIIVNGKLLRSVKKHVLLPAEMESIVLNMRKINEEVKSIKIEIGEE